MVIDKHTDATRKWVMARARRKAEVVANAYHHPDVRFAGFSRARLAALTSGQTPGDPAIYTLMTRCQNLLDNVGASHANEILHLAWLHPDVPAREVSNDFDWIPGTYILCIPCQGTWTTQYSMHAVYGYIYRT